MPTEGAQALHATKGAAMEFVDMGIKYILPLATFAVGATTGVGTWGGVNAVWGLVAPLVPGSSSNGGMVWLLNAGLFGGIFAGMGYGFWQLGKSDGRILHAVGRAFGGYFFGVAVSYVLAAVTNQAVGDGLIDNLIADLKGL